MTSRGTSRKGNGMKRDMSHLILTPEEEERREKENTKTANIWCSKIVNYPVLREKHEHVMLIYILSPLLYGKMHQPEKWLHWASECKLYTKSSDELKLIKPLTEDELQAVETMESAHSLIAKKFKDRGKSFVKEMLDLSGYIDSHEKMEVSFQRALINRNFLIITNELRDDPGRNLLPYEYTTGALILVLMQYCRHVKRFALEDKDDVELFQKQNTITEKKSDDVRTKGNKEFKESKYKAACQNYTSAIHLDPYNERLYSNRALTYLKTGDYTKARSDGKRAVILKAAWPKSQYRYAEALFSMDKYEEASDANLKALAICRANGCPASDLRDLETQRERFATKVQGQSSNTDFNQDSDDDNDDDEGVPDLVDQGSSDEERDADGQPFANKPPPLVDLDSDSDSDSENYPQQISDDDSGHEAVIPLSVKNKDSRDKELEDFRKKRAMHAEREGSDADDITDDKNRDRERRRQQHELVKPPPKEAVELEKEVTEEYVKLRINKYFKEASEELLEKRARSAVKSFRDAFCLIETRLKELKYDEFELVISLYAFGIACLETSQVQEIEIAHEKFECIIVEHESTVFPLAYYGKGRAYIKQNRFSEAIDPLMKGLLILCRHVHYGVCQWPGTKRVIEESDSKKMKEVFEINIELCKSPPSPDALCRFHDCSSYYKIQIYFSDPDFKGFVRTRCHEDCTVDFHATCWKKIKQENVERTQEKDFLGVSCFTPDCQAVIVYIVIYSQDGLKRKEFEGDKPVKVKDLKVKPVKIKAYSENKLEKLRLKKELKKELMRLAKENPRP